MISKIRLWNERDHMLNDGEKEVWCFSNEKGN